MLDHASISITEADKRMNSALSLKEYYTVYIIETKYVTDENLLKPLHNYLLLPITYDTNQITVYLMREELTVRHGLKQKECKSCHWQLDDILSL